MKPENLEDKTLVQCEHKYVFLRHTKRADDCGYQTHWRLEQFYFCEKCLKQTSTVQDTYSRDCPLWWPQ